MKSEIPPEDIWDKDVKYIVGHTFKDHVMRSNEDILLYIYDKTDPDTETHLEFIH